MNAGINYQSHRAEKLVAQASQVAKWIVVVPPCLFCQPLAVKRPTFHIRCKRNYFPKLRNSCEFLRRRNLPMMPGHTFVIRQRRHAPFGHFVHVTKVREKYPRRWAFIAGGSLEGPWCSKSLNSRTAPPFNFERWGDE